MYHFYTRLLFVCGFGFGVMLAVLYVKYAGESRKSTHVAATKNCGYEENYNRWFARNNCKRSKIPLDTLRYDNSSIYLLEARYLYHHVKIACVILVKKTRNAEAANNTWTSGCNRKVFVNLHTENRKIMPVKRSKENSSWVLLCWALTKVPDSYDWAVISYDDTFVILENVRLLVAGLDNSRKYYLGHAVTFQSIDYNLGQAGYLLSRGALQVLKNKFKTHDSCTADFTYQNQEDFYLGKHLRSLNVIPADTRDSLGFSTFHPHNLQNAFFFQRGLQKAPVFPVKCCSTKSITFNAIEASKIYTYYYLLYKLQIFEEGSLGNRPAPKTIPDEKVWKNFLHSRGIEKDDVSPQEYYKLWENLIDDPTVFAEKLKRDYD